MKTIFELNRYYIRRTLTSTRLVMPLVVTVVFCGIFYNENGINPYSSFAATIMLSFAIMGWSVHVLQKQEALEEQILILQCRGNALLYYGSRLFFFFLCDLFISFLILLIPCLFYLVNGPSFTLYPIHADMLIGYFALHVSAGLCGGMMISLLHPRIVSNQKLALPLACMLIIAAMTFSALLQDMQLPKIYACVFPPVSDISIQSAKWTQLPMRETGLYTLQMLLYAAVYASVQVRILMKRKFG